MHNAAARLIFSSLHFSHVTPMLYSLHWLSVKFRIDFKILTIIMIITFKAIHGQASDYICDLVYVKNFSMCGLCSNSEMLVPPSTKQRRHLTTGLSLLLHHHSGINSRVLQEMRMNTVYTMNSSWFYISLTFIMSGIIFFFILFVRCILNIPPC